MSNYRVFTGCCVPGPILPRGPFLSTPNPPYLLSSFTCLSLHSLQITAANSLYLVFLFCYLLFHLSTKIINAKILQKFALIIFYIEPCKSLQPQLVDCGCNALAPADFSPSLALHLPSATELIEVSMDYMCGDVICAKNYI